VTSQADNILVLLVAGVVLISPGGIQQDLRRLGL
jgi:hypothetical protein